MQRKKTEFNGSGSNVTSFPPDVFNLKNLAKLDLSQNNIRQLPREIDTLKSLETLNLHGNSIRTVFANFFNIKKLRILILSNNEIIGLPKQIGLLKSLKILDLSGNQISELPAEFSKLENLEELNLSGNKFSKFPKEILSLPKLKTLWIAKIDFEEFSSADIIKQLPNLKRLYCYSALRDITRTGLSQEYLALTSIQGNAIGALKNQNGKIPVKTLGPASQGNSNPNIFISYAHDDAKWLDMVTKHLKVLRMEGKNFEAWSDTMIKAGDKWKEEIRNALAKADIAILIISTSFLASDFIHTDELPPLLKSAQERGTKILPLIVNYSRFLETKSLSEFQAVNDPAKPLAGLTESEREKVLVSLINVVDIHLKATKHFNL